MEGRAQCWEEGDYNDTGLRGRGKRRRVIRETGMGTGMGKAKEGNEGNEGFSDSIFSFAAGRVGEYDSVLLQRGERLAGRWVISPLIIAQAEPSSCT